MQTDWATDALAALDRFFSGLELFQLAVPIVAIALALLLHRLLFRWVTRYLPSRFRDWLERVKRPLRLVFVLAGIMVSLPVAGLDPDLRDALRHVALVLLLVLLGWSAILVMDRFTRGIIARNRMDQADNLAARKYVTQARVLQRTANIVIVILTAIAVALTFEGVQEYGVSLFASAGAAGLILGLAARPVLANLIAGIQIAITQPIRLEDVVIVEGEWGWIEEIFATYVVVRIWDWRRMVVPLSYFIEKPFQNWTRETASIIGSVFWYLDYTVPVQEMRDKLTALVQDSAHWDGNVVNLQITDTDKDTVAVRALMSARTSPEAWDLRCEIREKMVVWLQETYPGALPRLRGEVAMRGDDFSHDDSYRRSTPDEGGVPAGGRA